MKIHKELFLISALAAISLPFNAEAVGKKPADLEKCKRARAWADLAMQARQMGVPIGDQLELAQPELGGSKAVLTRAYRYPRYNSSGQRAKVAKEFGRKVESECLKKSK